MNNSNCGQPKPHIFCSVIRICALHMVFSPSVRYNPPAQTVSLCRRWPAWRIGFPQMRYTNPPSVTRKLLMHRIDKTFSCSKRHSPMQHNIRNISPFPIAKTTDIHVPGLPGKDTPRQYGTAQDGIPGRLLYVVFSVNCNRNLNSIGISARHIFPIGNLHLAKYIPNQHQVVFYGFFPPFLLRRIIIKRSIGALPATPFHKFCFCQRHPLVHPS